MFIEADQSVTLVSLDKSETREGVGKLRELVLEIKSINNKKK